MRTSRKARSFAALLLSAALALTGACNKEDGVVDHDNNNDDRTEATLNARGTGNGTSVAVGGGAANPTAPGAGPGAGVSAGMTSGGEAVVGAGRGTASGMGMATGVGTARAGTPADVAASGQTPNAMGQDRPTAIDLQGAPPASGPTATSTDRATVSGTTPGANTGTMTPTAAAGAGGGATATPVTIDNRTRGAYESKARDRLSRISHRLSELRGKAGARGSSTAAQLEAERDELARRIDTAGTTAGTGWDQFRTDVGRAFDQLEADVEEAFDDPVR